MFTVCVLCMKVCMCTMYMECLQMPEEGVGSPATGVADGFELRTELRFSARAAIGCS